MVTSASCDRAGTTPAQLHAIVADAVNRADLDLFLAAHDDDATIVVPPDGRTAHGLIEIRAVITPLLKLAPSLTAVVVTTLQTPELALSYRRWRLAITEHGNRTEMHGLGTIVSRRVGRTWRVVLDDPLTGP